MNILDALKDITKHTHSLGFIEQVKVVGTAADAKIETKDVENTVIIYGSMYQPITGIESTIGLSRLSVLKGFISLHESSTVSIITDKRNNVDVPTDIKFDDGADTTSYYRFMAEATINELIKVPAFKGATWDITITPTLKSIATLSTHHGILSGYEKRFMVSVNAKGTLSFGIGAGPTDKTNIPFATSVTGTLKHQWTYPLSQVISILKLSDNASSVVMSFSDAGALKIDIDSGIGKYTYILPAGKS